MALRLIYLVFSRLGVGKVGVEQGPVEANVGHTPLLRLRVIEKVWIRGVEVGAQAVGVSPGGTLGWP